ncbi:cysteine-rich CWC family protein [Dysgonomonas sp. GY617]|uniref:cysteine-rich CWC family protein n=1 Tax=Dysgonomonas sp. GY617 TaxID=2780420 RepID=UPI0018834F90|nr:cysteine-rich CWC family protein [Dysgonomonas sp. GY617]MBF0576060.1 cysteine-rich CWC family protein [Dysgonomonas sp. GY617]
MDKICPCCSINFTCRVDKIELCNCSRINLAEGVRQYIKTTYGNCLCFDCLKDLNDQFVKSHEEKAKNKAISK